MIATRQEYREARRMVRDNGSRYAIRSIKNRALAFKLQTLETGFDELAYRAWAMGAYKPHLRQAVLKAELRIKYNR